MERVYVMRAETGLVKIGVSFYPDKRRVSVATQEKCRVTLEWVSLLHRFGRNVESRAHAKLLDRHVRSEWFSATVEDAIGAVIDAIDDFATDPDPYRDIPSIDQLVNSETVAVYLPSGSLALVDVVRGRYESRMQFFRKAIIAEVESRANPAA